MDNDPCSINPYSINQPAESLFYGRRQQVDKLVAALAGANAGNYALVGGRRFGKTSLLHAIERALWAAPTTGAAHSYRVIPVYINFLHDNITDWLDFFPLVFDCVTEQLAEHFPEIAVTEKCWKPAADPVQRLRDPFTESLVQLCKPRDQRAMPLRVLLLLDEIERIIDRPGHTDLFNKLRWYTYDEQKTNKYFKLVVTGSNTLHQFMNERGSPFYGVLSYEPLNAFSEQETRCLVQGPCNNDVPEAVVAEIVRCSGGHPYVIQYLMHHLLQKAPAATTPGHVKDLSAKMQRDCSHHFEIWRLSIGETGCRVFSTLPADGSWVGEEAISRAAGVSLNECQKSMTVLCYHGWAVSDDKGRYRAEGEIFRDWFVRNWAPLDPRPVPRAPLESLTRDQRKQLNAALVHAFNLSTLTRMLSEELDVSIGTFAADNEDFQTVVFNLTEWAERVGRLDDLLKGANEANGNNPRLKQFMKSVGMA